MEPIAQIRQAMLVASSLRCATVLGPLIPIILIRKFGDDQKWLNGRSINSQRDKQLDQNETQGNVHFNLIDNIV